MFELSDFYEYCRKNRVAVIPYSGMPAPGATVRHGGQYETTEKVGVLSEVKLFY